MTDINIGTPNPGPLQWMIVRAGDTPLLRISQMGDIEILAKPELLKELWLTRTDADMTTRVIALLSLAVKSLHQKSAGGLIIPFGVKKQ